MASIDEIERIAKEVASANTAPDAVVSVVARDAIGWEGDPIIRVSVVLADKAMEKFDGKTSIDVLSQLNERLERAGEHRFSTIDYATVSELAAEDGDSEP